MTEYLSPGVYVEEVTFHAEPIDGVNTDPNGLMRAKLYRAVRANLEDADVLRHCVNCEELPAALLAETKMILADFDAGKGIVVLSSSAAAGHRTAFIAELVRELPVEIYRIDLGAVVSKYIGETEKNLRKLFDAAERAGAVLFFDEADAVFGVHSEVKDSHDRYDHIEAGHLFKLMREFDGWIVLATKDSSDIDEANALGFPVINYHPNNDA